MPYFEAEVEVDVDEFLMTCSKREIDELINALVDDGYIMESQTNINKERSYQDREWDKLISKLTNSRMSISNEDIEVIKTILNKY